MKRGRDTFKNLCCLLGVVSTGLVLPGCVEWFPTKVSKGVARLSVRNAGAILKAIEEDSRCGFSSDIEPEIDGELGKLGSATWTVTNCEIQFSETLFETDCVGDTQHLDGKLVVSATKTITGWVSGDPADPIVPQTEDAARIEFTAEFDNFSVKTSAGPEWLKMKRGSMSVTATPRLAQIEDVGACAKSTPNVLFESITYDHAKLHVTTDDRDFDVDVPRSSFGAQAGIGQDGSENVLWGEIRVWDNTRSLNELILDPDYETDKYRETYLCSENYSLPLSHSCGMEETLGQGAAQLFVRAFGYTYLAVDHDEDCGFGSLVGLVPDDIKGIPLIDDEVEATWNADACTINALDEPKTIDTDCLGLDVMLAGSVQVDASKIVVGELAAGNPPILPRSRKEVTIDIPRMKMDNLEIWEEGPEAIEEYMTVESGSIGGFLYPITGESASQRGAYFIPTPVVSFRGLEVADADVAVHAEGKLFRFHIESATINAFRGSFEGESNAISGEILVNGVPVKVTGDLQPGYSQQIFDSTYSCTEDLLEVIPSD